MRNHKYVPVCFISCETLLHLKFPVSYKFEGTQNTKFCFLSLIYVRELFCKPPVCNKNKTSAYEKKIF